MVNITKIKELCKQKGLKQGFICQQLGVTKVYFNDILRGKNSMPDERIRKVAVLLGTSYEYLTDQTDDPAMNEGSETLKASADFIRDSSAKLLQQLNDVKNLKDIEETAEEMTLKSEIVELLDNTHDVQTLKMIKAALEAAKKGDE